MSRDSKVFISINDSEFIGMKKNEAFALCVSKGLTYRVVHEDGHSYIVTMDLRMDRVNFNIENNIVVASYIG